MVTHTSLVQDTVTNTPADELSIRAAEGEHEFDAVFRFRYDHFFKGFDAGYPGLDHEKRRVVEQHDLKAVHLCAFDAGGALVAVSTAVPAGLECNPETWRQWFAFDVLGTRRLGRTVVSTRMVLHPLVRRTSFFSRFHQAILRSYREAGYAFAVHYCRPEMVSRYELLGHSLYHQAFRLPSGQLRVPMIMVLDAQAQTENLSLTPPHEDKAACGTTS